MQVSEINLLLFLGEFMKAVQVVDAVLILSGAVLGEVTSGRVVDKS